MLLALLLGAGFAFDSDEPAKPAPKAAPAAADRHARAARGADPRPALRDAAQARRRSAPRQAKREGLEDLDRSYPAAQAPRRRGGAQAARAARARRRPARRVGDDLRPGRGRLLRPAHQAPADRPGRPDREPRAQRDHARPRAHARARGPALRARPRGDLGLRRRRARLPRARRGLGDRGDVHLRRAPLLRRADARRAALLARAGHRRPAAVHRGAADLPLRPRPAVRAAALRDRRRQLVAGQLRLPLPPAGLERADHAPRQVPAGRAARAGAAGRSAGPGGNKAIRAALTRGGGSWSW